MFNIQLKPTTKDKFVLVEDYSYGGITIPAGYETNGADVPWLATLVIPRYLPSNLPMVAMHDYLTGNEKYRLADDMFEKMFIEAGYTIRRKLAVKAVRFYHKIKYKV
jgi:hypothetical protein